MTKDTTIQEYEKKIQDLNTIINVTKSITKHLEIEDLLKNIVSLYIHLFKNPNIILFFNQEYYSDGIQKLYLIENYNKYNKTPKEIDCNSKFFTFLKTAKRSVVLKDIPKTNYFSSMNKNSAFIPLYHKDTIRGLIVIESQKKEHIYNEYQLKLMDSVSCIISIAMENVILYNMATIDSLTGLKMKHVFHQKIQKILHNVKVGNTLNAFLILIDIDNFKNINDIYGHQAGDTILKKIGNIILNKTRKSDICSRYGGDEIAIVMSNTSLSNVVERVNDITRAVKKIKLNQFKNLSTNAKTSTDEMQNVFLSMGIAEALDIKYKNYKELITDVDRALLKAKKEGKNKMVITNTEL